MTDIHKWGFLNKTKWVLIEAAPLTGSGLNEILIAGPTKKDVSTMAKACGFKLGPFFKVIKLEDIKENK